MQRAHFLKDKGCGEIEGVKPRKLEEKGALHKQRKQLKIEC